MREILTQIQKDIIKHLKEEMAKEKMSINIYDTAPINIDENSYPFFCFEDISFTPHGYKTRKGAEIELNIKGYSHSTSSEEIKNLTMIIVSHLENLNSNLDIIQNEVAPVQVFEDPEYEQIYLCDITQRIIAWEEK